MRSLPFFCLVTFLAVIEVVQIWLCREFIGPVSSGMGIVQFVLFPNLVALIVGILFEKKIIALLMLSVTLLFIISSHSIGYIQSFSVQRQASVLVEALYQKKSQTGQFPIEISSDVLKASGLDDHFHNYESDGSKFTFYYSVMTPSISHYYSSEFGWGHGDD